MKNLFDGRNKIETNTYIWLAEILLILLQGLGPGMDESLVFARKWSFSFRFSQNRLFWQNCDEIVMQWVFFNFY
jgi:hypothetical protein